MKRKWSAAPIIAIFQFEFSNRDLSFYEVLCGLINKSINVEDSLDLMFIAVTALITITLPELTLFLLQLLLL